MKQARLYRRQDRNLRCLACQHYCRISPGKTGFCGTRKNQSGRLSSLTYGQITGIQADPIEKKPLHRFRPGTTVASFGSLGCNFRCKQCLNYANSWGNTSPTVSVSPKNLVNQIKASGFPGLAFTFNEPAINPEFVHDTAKLAKQHGLFTVFVTNGFWTEEALDYYGRFIDAANIDFKGFSEKTYRKMGAFFKNIPEMALLALKKYKIHLEITTLLIPTINDNPAEIKKMTTWIAQNLGPKTPWHISRYDPGLAPDPDFAKLPPTSPALLEIARNIGLKSGIKYIYTSNH